MTQVYAANDQFWKIYFRFFKPVTDNVALCLLFTGIACGIIFYFLKKVLKIRGVGILEALAVGSVYRMLTQLPLLHGRMKTALSTLTSILNSSTTYMSAFEERSGLSSPTSSNIVQYIWHLSPAEIKDATSLNPQMLYEKICKLFMDTRYLFGWINERPKNIFYVFLIVLCIVFLITMGKREKISEKVLLMVQCVFIAGLWTTKAGCIVILTVILFTEWCFINAFGGPEKRKREKSSEINEAETISGAPKEAYEP